MADARAWAGMDGTGFLCAASKVAFQSVMTLAAAPHVTAPAMNSPANVRRIVMKLRTDFIIGGVTTAACPDCSRNEPLSAQRGGANNAPQRRDERRGKETSRDRVTKPTSRPHKRN